jgi:hypothetical protein
MQPMQAHAANAEGAGGQLVAVFEKVAGLVAQEGDDHVARDYHFVWVLGPEEATEGARKSRVG